MNYSTAAAVGAISGLRSFAGPAIVANRIGSPGAAHLADALAVTELIADKLPFIPDRVKPGSLAFRAISGAACGYLLANRNKKERTQGEKWMSAVVAGAAAVAASYAGFEFRKRVKLPPLVAALIEDAFTVGSGAAVAALIGQ